MRQTPKCWEENYKQSQEQGRTAGAKYGVKYQELRKDRVSSSEIKRANKSYESQKHTGIFVAIIPSFIFLSSHHH